MAEADNRRSRSADRIIPLHQMAHQSDYIQIQLLLSNNRIAEAKVLCVALTREHPDDADAWFLLGAIHAGLGEFAQVVDCCQKVVVLQPNHGMAYYNMGVALQELHRYHRAEAAYRNAIRLQPENALAIGNLAAVYVELGRMPEAVEMARQALHLNPSSPHTYNNLGLALNGEKRYEEAIQCFREALKINPAMAEAHYNLGNTYYKLGQPERAIPFFKQAIGINAKYADAYCDFGAALCALGDLPQALEQFHRAIELCPDHADAHWNRSLNWLQTGNFESGWPEYEWRWRRKNTSRRILSGIRWDGSLIHGKRIFIHAEQGLGDTIQFVRYLPFVKEQKAFVIFECQPELFNLLRSCKGIDQLIRRGDPLPPFDIHVPLLSLPGIFHTTLESIPYKIPYIESTDNAKIDAMILPRNSEQHVGIVWAGSTGHPNDRNRSCPLVYFAALANIPKVRLFSLQKSERASELKTNDFGRTITDMNGVLDDFADTAAAVTKLDLVITVDTSVAHLAGAMGKPVWVLLPFMSDWRWLLDREDSPWYPTMRLFRQPKPGDWESVITRVAAELTALVQRQTTTGEDRVLAQDTK